MTPNTPIALVEAADALDSNNRLLRMFELDPSSLPRPTAQKNTAPLPASMPRWGVIKPRSPIFRLLLTAKTRKTAPISPI